MNPHITTLVVDFDDTIATTFNRDWANATANRSLIDKLNDLYDQGWTVHIVTARGQISCNGDCDAADRKYRSQIEKWLRDHGVQYTDLSFQKKLAAYYIDDKGITPEQFVEKFDRIPLKGGWSGATVYYDKVTDSVYKTASNSIAAVEWYKVAASYGYATPHIHNLIGETIRMERLPEYTGNTQGVLDTLGHYAGHAAMHPEVSQYSYVLRCVNRLNDPDFTVSDRMLVSNRLTSAMYHTPLTFSHGDASISNVMGCNDLTQYPCMIDPLNDPSLYSSWVIDVAKLYMSLELCGGEHERSYIESKNLMPLETLRAHELGHLCRVYPYAKNRTYIQQLIKTKINALR
jgi:hypothetical protein